MRRPLRWIVLMGLAVCAVILWLAAIVVFILLALSLIVPVTPSHAATFDGPAHDVRHLLTAINETTIKNNSISLPSTLQTGYTSS